MEGRSSSAIGASILQAHFAPHLARQILRTRVPAKQSSPSSPRKIAGFCKLFNCCLIHPLLLVNLSQVEVADPEMRVHFYRLLQLFDSRIVLARLKKEHSKQRISNQRERIELTGSFRLGKRFLVPSDI